MTGLARIEARWDEYAGTWLHGSSAAMDVRLLVAVAKAAEKYLDLNYGYDERGLAELDEALAGLDGAP